MMCYRRTGVPTSWSTSFSNRASGVTAELAFDLRERAPRVIAEVHRFHAERAGGRDVVAVVVDEDGFLRLDAHALACEHVDLAVGLAHPDVARVDDLVEQL